MKNLIGGEKLDASNGAVIEVINPATKEVIDTVPNSTVEDVDIAVKIAKNSQKEWGKVSIHERGEILLKFASLVEEKKEELATLLCNETGKPIKEARAEIGNMKMFVSSYVEKARHDYGNVIPAGSEPGQEKTIQFTVQAPLGVVACIIPFNFPSDLFGQKVPSALVMGNSVIVKPSTYNPLTLHRYCELLQEAGVPNGVINCVSGDGPIVGEALAMHPDVNLISVTGSTKVGAEVMGNASKNITHVMLELGGNDAFILDKDGDIDLAVEELVWGRLYNTGQVCCASKRFLVQKGIKDEFIKKAVETLQSLKVAMPQQEDADIGCLINEKAAINAEEQVRKTLDQGCLINENAAIRVSDQVKETVSQGANIVVGGRRKGAFFEPTIIDNVTKDMDVMKDMEIFGPVIPVCTFENIDEAIEIANQSSYGLCGCIFTRDMKNAFKVANSLEVGGAVINGASFFRSAEMPFGGWKHSGIGNEGVSTTLKEMSRTKTIVLKNILD